MVRGRLLKPLWFTEHSVCGNEKLLYTAALTHTDTQTCTHTLRYNYMQAHTVYLCRHTHIVNTTSEIPGSFDLPAAVMSLVVKLLFPFNIVYRQRHLFAGTVICPLGDILCFQ